MRKTVNKRIHHGANLKWLMKASGFEKNVIAEKLQLPLESILKYEDSDILDDEILLKFSTLLNIPLEILKKLESGENEMKIINNSFKSKNISHNSNSSNVGAVFGDNKNSNTINHPIEKIIELAKEKDILFERLLQQEKDQTNLFKDKLVLFNEIKQELTKLKETLNVESF